MNTAMCSVYIRKRNVQYLELFFKKTNLDVQEAPFSLAPFIIHVSRWNTFQENKI